MDAIDTGGLTAHQFIDTDLEFHMAIGTATHNPPAISLMAELVRWMRQRVWLTGSHLIVSKRGPQYQADHRAILAAIAGQDSEAARSRMAEHLASISSNLRSFSQISEEE
jgi:DNA-binding FadR family transcriptional regulator